mmetsp:Transcript_29335/g.54074  ORF Transcript_29335/g.54074 Transcript_29335/m.54074 type:complete len:218 (-) Transcript_29335:36-689(-)
MLPLLASVSLSVSSNSSHLTSKGGLFVSAAKAMGALLRATCGVGSSKCFSLLIASTKSSLLSPLSMIGSERVGLLERRFGCASHLELSWLPGRLNRSLWQGVLRFQPAIGLSDCSRSLAHAISVLVVLTYSFALCGCAKTLNDRFLSATLSAFGNVLDLPRKPSCWLWVAVCSLRPWPVNAIDINTKTTVYMVMVIVIVTQPCIFLQMDNAGFNNQL